MWLGDGRRWQAILAANEGLDPNRLQIGQRIKLPRRDAAPGTPPASPAGAASPATGASSGSESGSQPTSHVVQTGDTLYSIAKRRLGDGTRWDEIYEANKAAIGDDPRKLKVGMRLTLPK